MLKEQVEKLLQENDIWKRGFKTLHGQKEDFDRCSQELQQLKNMMAERDEQLKRLQVTFTIFFSAAFCCRSSETYIFRFVALQIENYDLKLRLVREQQSSPMPGRFHPDIFG